MLFRSNICSEINNIFSVADKLVSKAYDIEFNLPIRGEISYGRNLKEMTEWHASTK